MMALARNLFFIALSAGLTWLVLLRDTELELPPRPLRVAFEELIAPPVLPEQVAAAEAPETAQPPPAPEPEAQPEPEPTPEPEPEAAPAPPPELGRSDGEGDLAATGEDGDQAGDAPAEVQATEAEPSEPEEQPVGVADVDALRADPELNQRARAELAGEARQGFATVIHSAAADQLEIARSFGEEVVLVPKAALAVDGTPAPYWRLDLESIPRIEAVPGPFKETHPRYRNLFDYEYGDLPQPVRELRRQVMDRSQIYIFAALMPTSEWAVAVGRRDEALDRLGLSIDDVERFVLRYARTSNGRFDFRVERVDLVDGRRMTLSPDDL
ncbi:MAG: hypothetical protein AAFZ65_09365 [Planctomycetota bacterium]